MRVGASAGPIRFKYNAEIHDAELHARALHRARREDASSCAGHDVEHGDHRGFSRRDGRGFPANAFISRRTTVRLGISFQVLIVRRHSGYGTRMSAGRAHWTPAAA